MMVKTEAYGVFGSGGKRRVVRQKSSIGKGKKRDNHILKLPSTRSTTSSGATASCLITTNRPNGSFLLSSPSLLSSATSAEHYHEHLAPLRSSWLMTKKRWSGVRKKSFTNLTPFTFPKLKLNNTSFFTYNAHVSPSIRPLARANLKFLFEKRLQKSDVGGLKRVILPKHPAENYLPTLPSKEGFFIWMDDMDGEHCWKFKFRYWPNNTSRMYVLENTGDFTDEHKLKEGDHILFYQDCDTSEYVVQAKKAKAQKDSYVEYEVQDSSSDFSNGTLDNDLPSEAKTSQKQEENEAIVNYFVYEDGCSSEFHTDKVSNAVEDIPPYYPLFAPDEGEDGDDDIDKYLCLEGPESSKNSAVNAGSCVLPTEPGAFIKQDGKGKGLAHENEGTSNSQIENASKIGNNLVALEHEISPKGGNAATSSDKTTGIPDFFYYAPESIPEGITYKVDEWGMPYGYETSLEKDTSLDFWATGGF